MIFYSFQVKHQSHLATHLQAFMPVPAWSGDDCDCQRSCSCVYFSVCFNDLLMDDCLSSEWGFLTHSSVQPFPCLRFRSGLSPFWSSLSLFRSISRLRSPHTTSLPQCPFESSTRTNVLKRKGLEEAWQACVTGERFTWGHKSRGERGGGIAHIKGSVCGGKLTQPVWRLDSPHTPPANHPIHTLPSGRWLFSFGQNTPTFLSSLSHSLHCLLFPLEDYGPPRYFITVFWA